MYFSILRSFIPKLILGCCEEFDRLHVPPPKILADQSLMGKVSQQPRRQSGMLALSLEIWLDYWIESLSQHWTELFIYNDHLCASNHSFVSSLCLSRSLLCKSLRLLSLLLFLCSKGTDTSGMFFLLTQTQIIPHKK